ncbi:MAG: hypothetical protein GX303_08320 [Clostridiales bacterium]|nr:hypothetical protein [Clostridiales bacterium]
MKAFFEKRKTHVVIIFLVMLTVSISVLTCAAITNAQTKAIRAEIESMIDLISNAKFGEKSNIYSALYADGTPMYIICEHNGKIGIFDSQKGELIEVLDRYVYSLPDADKQFLKKGIPIYSFSELLSLIEDYTS